MIRQVAKVDHYKKGEHLLDEGEVCQKAGLLVKGLVRFYYINEGKDITSRLLEEGTIIKHGSAIIPNSRAMNL